MSLVRELDYKANDLGAHLAILIHKYLKENQEKSFDELMGDVIQIFKTLDGPIYKTPDRILSRDQVSGKYYTTPLLVP